jgi:hypothetical protein
VPLELQASAQHDARLASRLLDLFTRTVFFWQRRQARHLGAADPGTPAA